MNEWHKVEPGNYDYRDSKQLLGYVLRAGIEWMGVVTNGGTIKYFPTCKEAKLHVETIVALES